LSTLPPSHAYELVAGQLAPLSAGARVVYAGALLPNRLVETMRTQAVTRMILVPALLQAIVREVVGTLADRGVLDQSCPSMTARELAAAVRALDASERARINAAIRDIIGPAFHVVTLGGAASDPAWTDVLAFAGIDLDLGYGLTEAGPVVAMGRAADCPAGSVGRPLPGVNVRIGTDDEILVQSPAAMTGYAADDRATAEAFADGWLRTGDRGRIDSDGFLFISGRIKEAMVTSAGETIYPDEIEPFYASPLFAEFAVVPVQAADGNDEPTLVIVPADSTPTDVLRREVATLRAAAPARLRIAGFAHRRDALPRSAAGKIRRRALADDIRLQERLS
ncbi:MAG TPA: class I adenylate-forming enzyme family protein, partial [Vicinamibacterales bacterium]|nr:class I adenylate-forming enzyme family protein [Vicinamibacterales bacterium]